MRPFLLRRAISVRSVPNTGVKVCIEDIGRTLGPKGPAAGKERLDASCLHHFFKPLETGSCFVQPTTFLQGNEGRKRSSLTV